TEACAYVETGINGDSRGSRGNAGVDSVCTDVVNSGEPEPAASGDVASECATDGDSAPRRCEHDDTGRNQACDHHFHGGHGTVVRADRRGAAAKALVVQPVPREL